MRSQVIFEARERIANRYTLVHAVARVTRCLHFSSSCTQDAISDAFVRVAHERCLAKDLEWVAGEDAIDEAHEIVGIFVAEGLG